MKRKLIIGERGSRLAVVQAELVAARLRQLHPDLEIDFRRIVTEGDRNRQVTFEQADSVGMFVKALEEALLDGRIDLAVHSLKDVPTQMPDGVHLCAVTERADPRDVLIARAVLCRLPSGARIGTSSLRRSVQLAAFRPDLQACGIRGNVDTRIGKVASGELDGVILAAAGMERLNWQERITEYLSPDIFLPAVGQGALALETRIDDVEVEPLVSPLNHLPTWQSVVAERAFLLALGGGCRAPIAALGTLDGQTIKLDGMVAGPRGERILRSSLEGRADAPEELGRALAGRFVEMGAGALVDEVGPG